MVRRVYAQQKVLELYQNMKSIRYPMAPEKLLGLLPIPTRMMSYSEMAKASKCAVEDVAVMCSSEAGATHYDAANDRCLILYNDAMPAGRILWTQCHEIGHICMGHLLLLSNPQIADTGGRAGNELEQEADYFAWNLIAPMPIMRELGVCDIPGIIRTFGMSVQAANLHLDRFQKWMRGHTKTAWENNLIREYRKKKNNWELPSK